MRSPNDNQKMCKIAEGIVSLEGLVYLISMDLDILNERKSVEEIKDSTDKISARFSDYTKDSDSIMDRAIEYLDRTYIRESHQAICNTSINNPRELGEKIAQFILNLKNVIHYLANLIFRYKQSQRLVDEGHSHDKIWQLNHEIAKLNVDLKNIGGEIGNNYYVALVDTE